MCPRPRCFVLWFESEAANHFMLQISGYFPPNSNLLVRYFFVFELFIRPQRSLIEPNSSQSPQCQYLIQPMLCHEYALQETDEQEDDSHDRDIRHPMANTNSNANSNNNTFTTTNEGSARMSDDTAGLMVMFYLLFISTSFIGTILGGFFIAIRYGFVVLTAVTVAIFGMFVVVVVLMNAVAQEKSLMRATKKIQRCVCLCLVYLLTLFAADLSCSIL